MTGHGRTKGLTARTSTVPRGQMQMAQDDRSVYALVLYGNIHEDGLYRAERCTYSFQYALSSMSFGSCRQKQMIRIGSSLGTLEAG